MPTATVGQFGDPAALEVAQKLEGRGLSARRLDAQKVVDLPDEDDEGDAGGEAGDDRRGDEGDETPHAQQADDQDDDAGQQPGDPDAFQPDPLADDDEHRAHGAGGAGNLIGGAGERADDQAGKDGRHQAGGSGGAGGDAEGQGQGQRNRGDRQAGEQILTKLCRRYSR